MTVASTRPGTATGMGGAKVAVQRAAPGAEAAFDALVLAGGAGAPAHLWESEPLRRLVQAFHRAGKPVAAICLAGPALARAGVLAGRRATVFPTRRAVVELKRGGARYVAEPLVEDANLLTADGPEASAAFGAALLNLLDRCPTNR